MTTPPDNVDPRAAGGAEPGSAPGSDLFSAVRDFNDMAKELHITELTVAERAALRSLLREMERLYCADADP
jgi:hypothetical protein